MGKEKVEARNELESYAHGLKNQINDKEKMGAKLSSEEKETIENAVTEAIEWLEANQDADSSEFQERKKALEEVVQPIVSKLYQGGEGGPPPGGEYAGGEDYDKDEL